MLVMQLSSAPTQWLLTLHCDCGNSHSKRDLGKKVLALDPRSKELQSMMFCNMTIKTVNCDTRRIATGKEPDRHQPHLRYMI